MKSNCSPRAPAGNAAGPAETACVVTRSGGGGQTVHMAITATFTVGSAQTGDTLFTSGVLHMQTHTVVGTGPLRPRRRQGTGHRRMDMPRPGTLHLTGEQLHEKLETVCHAQHI